MAFTHLALLRAINTGRRRVTNADLVAAFAALGFTEARAYQASGNVAFDGGSTPTTVLRDELESGLADELGFEVPTILRTAEEVRTLATEFAFDDAEFASLPEGKLQVIFLDHEPDPDAIDALLPEGPDLLRLVGEQIYWLPEKGISTSALAVGSMPRTLGRVTVRTHGSVQRMAKLF